MAEPGSENNEQLNIPPLADAKYLPATIPWLRQRAKTNAGLSDHERWSLIQREQEILLTVRNAEAELEDFNKPVTAKKLLEYSSLAAAAGDPSLMEVVCARMTYGFPDLELEGAEETKHIGNLADVFYTTALVFRDQSEELRRLGNVEEADYKILEAKAFYSRYKMHLGVASGVYKDLANTRNLDKDEEKRIASYFEELNLFYSPDVFTAAGEAGETVANLDPELNEESERSERDQGYLDAGVDPRWLSVKTGLFFNRDRFPEANRNYDLLIKIAADRYNVPEKSVAAVLAFESREAMQRTANEVD